MWIVSSAAASAADPVLKEWLETLVELAAPRGDRAGWRRIRRRGARQQELWRFDD